MEENYDMRDVLLSNAAARNQKRANIKRVLTAIAILFVLLLIILIIMKSINSGNINNERAIIMPSESELNKQPKVEQKQAIVIKKQQTQPSPQPKSDKAETPKPTTPGAEVKPNNEFKETIVLKKRDDEPVLAPKVETKVETKIEAKVETKKETPAPNTKVVVTADKNKKVEQPVKAVENKKAESKPAKTESKKTTQNTAKQTTQKTEKQSTKTQKVEKTEQKQSTQKVTGWLQVRSLPGHNANLKSDPIYGKVSGLKYKLENVEIKGAKYTRVLIPYTSAEDRAKLKEQFPGAW